MCYSGHEVLSTIEGMGHAAAHLFAWPLPGCIEPSPRQGLFHVCVWLGGGVGGGPVIGFRGAYPCDMMGSVFGVPHQRSPHHAVAPTRST